MNQGNGNQMASSNPYSLPPLAPMTGGNSVGATPNHMYYTTSQQQHQSERISGDGEEVHRYGYMPTGIPAAGGMAPPPLGTPASVGVLPPPQIQQPASAPPPPMNYGGYEASYTNQGPSQNPYDYQMSAFQPMAPMPGGVVDNAEAYGGLNENRSIEGEEQHQQLRYGPGNDLNMMQPQGVFLNSSPQPNFLTQNAPSLPTSHTNPMNVESYEPVGVDINQQYQSLQPEERSETIGSAAVEDTLIPPPTLVGQEEFRATGDQFGYDLGDQSENDPRSIEGQEFPDPEDGVNAGSLPVTFIGQPASSVSVSGSVTLNTEHRSQTIGSEMNEGNESRSIEGREQDPGEHLVGAISGSAGSSASNNPPNPISSGGASLPSSHARSETLGSDSVHDDQRPPPASKNAASKQHHVPSGSETGDSVGRVGGGREKDPSSRRVVDSDEEKRKHRNKGRHGDYDRERRRYPSYDDDDSFEDDRSVRFDKRRDRDKELDRRSKPRSTRDRRNDSRRVDDWDDTVSMKETSRHYSSSSRHYPNDQEDYRPRSRNSYYERDDYYDRRPKRRPGEFSGYSTRDRDNYRYPRHDVPPHGYLDNSRGPYVPTQGRPPYAAANNTQQAQLSKLEQFRIDYPSLYTEWYRKYTAHMSNPAKYPLPNLPAQYQVAPSVPRPAATSDGNQRPPSGLSSVGNDGLHPNEFIPIQEQPREPSPPKRSTPQKFLSSHSLAVLTPLGKMIRVRNGGTVVEFMNLKPLMKRAPEYKEVRSFPGPLIKDVTHKKTIITFCERKIRELESNHAQVDRDNLILLWELLILLLRQNGMAIGSDIAELLLKSKSKPAGGSENSRSSRDVSDSESDNNDEIQQSEGVVNGLNEAKCIEKFCEKLIYGRKKEALEYAMDNGLWGHALFFASKMDQRTYGNVLARFANGMSMNSPLQTLYQILSGNQPASVTSCCDDGFGDWKPHLAMILSNTGLKPEIEGKAIATLGDTLASRNQPFAAQFCYLMAHAEFSPDSKIGSLLGYIPSKNNLIEATQMTEIYEFARSLGDSEVTLGTCFLRSKLQYTETLLSLGFVQEAYLYCEEMTKALKKGKVLSLERLVAWDILRISERLIKCEDSNSSEEPVWIEELKRMSEAAYGESESSYSRKQSFATSVSDRNVNELPAALDQLNLNSYSDMYTPSNVVDSGETHDQVSNFGTTQSSVSVPDLSATNQWTQPNQRDTGFDPHGVSNNWNGSLNNNQNYSNPPSFEPASSNSIHPLTNSLHSQPSETLSTQYGSEAPNNNYLSNPQFENHFMSGPGIHPPPQPSVLSGSNRKKSVRFEDEELLTGKGAAHDLGTLLDNLTSRVAHERQTLRKSKSLSFGSISGSGISESPSDSTLHKRSACRSDFQDKFRNHSENSSPAASPLKFKSTFPIDQPLSKSSVFKKMPGQRKLYTYPVDEKCCDSNEPCDEHDHYLSENEGSYSPVKSNTKHDPDKTDMPTRPMDNSKPPPPKPQEKKPNKDENKSQNKQQPKKGFLGSILGVLNRNKGPNQMHLPEDKQPTIVWDAQKGQWVNTTGEDEGDSGPKGPPPKDSELSGAPPPMSGGPPSLPSMPPSQHFQNPPAPSNPNMSLPNNVSSLPPNASNLNRQTSQTPAVRNGAIPNSMPTMGGPANKYKQAKGLGIGKKYVNAWTQENAVAAVSSEPVVPLPGGTGGGGFGQPNIFMPVASPVGGDAPTSFLTASLEPLHSNEGSDSQPAAPQMFNPAQFQNQNNADYSLNR